MYRNYQNEEDADLEGRINTSSIKKWYIVEKWSLIILGTLCTLIYFILLIIYVKKADKAGVLVDTATVISYIVKIFAIPFICWLAWICTVPLIGLVYDVKMIKYKYFADQKIQKQQEVSFSNIADKKDLNGYSQDEILREADNFGKRIQMPKREPVNEKTNQKYELTVDEIVNLIEKHSKK